MRQMYLLHLLYSRIEAQRDKIMYIQQFLTSEATSKNHALNFYTECIDRLTVI